MARRRASPSGAGKDTIADEQSITCSVGVARRSSSPSLPPAQAKPGRLLVVLGAGRGPGLPAPVAGGALWGVGDLHRGSPATAGLHTVADLLNTPVTTRAAPWVMPPAPICIALAWGRDERRVLPQQRSSSARLRRDLRPGHRRSRCSSTASCCAWPTGPCPGAFSRPDGTHRHPQGAVRRLHDDHPQPHPARDPTRCVRRSAAATALFDALACSAPGSAWSACEWRSRAARAAVQPRLDDPDFGWRDADRAVDRASAQPGAGVRKACGARPGESAAHPGSMPRGANSARSVGPGQPAGAPATTTPGSGPILMSSTRKPRAGWHRCPDDGRFTSETLEALGRVGHGTVGAEQKLLEQRELAAAACRGPRFATRIRSHGDRGTKRRGCSSASSPSSPASGWCSSASWVKDGSVRSVSRSWSPVASGVRASPQDRPGLPCPGRRLHGCSDRQGPQVGAAFMNMLEERWSVATRDQW